MTMFFFNSSLMSLNDSLTNHFNANSESLKFAKYIDITHIKDDLTPPRISIN